MLVKTAIKKYTEKIYVRHIVCKLPIVPVGQQDGIQIGKVIFMIASFLGIPKPMIAKKNDYRWFRG